MAIHSLRLPSLSPINAAPASGTARNSDSSHMPAWSEGATADSHGTVLASTLGSTSASAGVHQCHSFVAMA